MAFTASMELNGSSYELRSARVYLFRGQDEKGRPLINSEWRISVILDAMNDPTISEWMIDPYKKMDGKIYIRCREGNKEIEFKEAFCMQMTDEYNPGIDFASCECHIRGKELLTNSTPYTIPNWLVNA